MWQLEAALYDILSSGILRSTEQLDVPEIDLLRLFDPTILSEASLSLVVETPLLRLPLQ